MKTRIIILVAVMSMATTAFSQDAKISALLAKAQSGDVNAMVELADKYRSGIEYLQGSTLYTKTYPEEALKWYLKAEEAGSKKVQYGIAEIYHHGNGATLPINNGKAMEYYQKALLYDSVAYHTPALDIAEIYHYDDAYLDYDKAMEYYKKALERKEWGAEYEMGQLYLLGEITSVDYDEAFRLFRKCSTGDGDASFRIGEMYLLGLGRDVNYQKALEWFLYASKCPIQGSFEVATMKKIADIYYDGLGVEQNFQEALNWYQKAIKKGKDKESLLKTGMMYLFGEGVEQNNDKAKNFVKQAAEQGDATAMNLMKTFFAGNPDGLVDAASVLAGNFNSQFKFYLKAAESGGKKGMLLAGMCYNYGFCVDQDYKEAMRWWREAVDKFDDPDAMNLIGELYYLGHGMEKDYKLAYEWFEKASEKGSQSAKGYMGVMYYEGQYVEKDYNKAFILLSEAAENGGDALCMRVLAQCYRYGLGGAKVDSEKEKYWMEKSAEYGDKHSKEILEKFYKQ